MGAYRASNFRSLLQDPSTACFVCASIRLYRATASRPFFVNLAPPPRLPPRDTSTRSGRNRAFEDLTSFQARIYDIPIRRAAERKLPVFAMSSKRSTRPGPRTVSPLHSTRKRGRSATEVLRDFFAIVQPKSRSHYRQLGPLLQSFCGCPQ